MSEPISSSRLLPSGTVTFVFTDIEGSTKLLERLHERYAIILVDSSDILRAIAEKFGGIEVDTQGDAFFIAFHRAPNSILFACEAQRTLAAHAWPEGLQVKIRMGLHTGEATVSRTNYVGMDVHRAARLAASAHGGQVVLSATTRALLDETLLPDATVRDLGEFKLKDVGAMRTYQLDISGLPTEFPPLKTLDRKSELPAPGEPPFMGLHYFDTSNAHLFFGREAVAEEIIQRLRQENFIAVIGASGSGKSSVVRAGVIPALGSTWQAHVITPTAQPLETLAAELTRQLESVTATSVLMDDLTGDPRSLALYLKRQGRDAEPFAAQPSHRLIVVDQFEELFTQCRDENTRHAFIQNLFTAAQENVVSVILTLRADFYGYLAEYADLRDTVAEHQIYIGLMTQDELRRAIEEPAKRNGWDFDPGLVDLILHDVGQEPGALPLLSHALLETWNRRSGTRLMLNSYEKAGGVRGAIAKTADRVFDQELNPDEQQIARNLFLRLTELGEGTPDTRRRAALTELVPRAPNAEAEKVQRVLTRLADARLITTDEGMAEVAHEALIREWHTLREWLSEGRAGLLLHRHLTNAAQEWELLERDPDALYRGVRLVQALEYARQHPERINPNERAFLDASTADAERAQDEREARRQREIEQVRQLADEQAHRAEEQATANKKLRRRAFILVGVVIVALGLAGLTLFLNDQSNRHAVQAEQNAQTASQAQATAVTNAAAAHQAEQEAIHQQRITLSRELAGSAINNLDADPERSILLAMQAVTTTYAVDGTTTKEAAEALHRAVMNSRLRSTLYPNPGDGYGLAISADGKRLATSGRNGLIQLWDLQSRKELLTLTGHGGNINSVVFSPDGSRLASASGDGTAKVWDLGTGQLIHDLRGHTDEVITVAFSPNGNRIVTASLDQTARVWDAVNGKLLVTFTGHDAPVLSAQFSPDGTRIATAGDDVAVRVWDSTSGQELYKLSDFVRSVSGATFSPDGKILATNGDEDPKLWDAQTGKQLFLLPGWGATFSNQGPAYTPDGKYVAIAGQDGKVSMWETTTGRPYLTFATGTPVDGAIQFTPECVAPPTNPYRWCGRFLITGNRDESVRFWDVSPTGNREVLVLPGFWHCLVPDATKLHTATLEGGGYVQIHTWRFPEVAAVVQPTDLLTTPTQDLSSYPAGKSKDLGTVAFTADCSRSAVVDQTNLVATITDTASGKQLLQFKLSEGTRAGSAIGASSLSPDGTRFATLGPENTAKIWDLANGGKELLTLKGHSALLISISFSPDGKRLATASQDKSAKIWDAQTGQELLSLNGHTHFVGRVVFNQDGTRLATGSFDRTVKVWDLESGKALFTLSGAGASVWAIGFSPDGKLIATGSNDGTLRLWDATTGQELLTLPIPSQPFQVNFTPDHSRLVLGTRSDTQVYLPRIEDVFLLAQSRVTRSLTTDECRQFLHVEQCPP